MSEPIFCPRCSWTYWTIRADGRAECSRCATLWQPEDDVPIVLNEGTKFAEPFGVSIALLWAERLAREWLGR